MQSRRWFTLISFALLVGCGGQQPSEEQETSSGRAAGSSGLVDLLPADDAVAGWTQDGEPRLFSADDLWEFIDGAAEGYLLYGFEQVVTSDYNQETMGQGAVIDIYRMMDPVHAFGIYCQERNPEYEFLSIGGGGYVTGTALNFWKGPYYVKMTVFEESDALKSELLKLAEVVSGKIDEPSTLPPEVAYLPTEDQKPHTIQFLPKDVLGQSYLSNAFEAQYEAEGQEYKIVISTMEGPERAAEGLAKYGEFLSGSSGREPQPVEGLGDEGFVGEDNYYGKVLAVRSGDRIVIVLGAPSDATARSAVERVLGKL